MSTQIDDTDPEPAFASMNDCLNAIEHGGEELNPALVLRLAESAMAAGERIQAAQAACTKAQDKCDLFQSHVRALQQALQLCTAAMTAVVKGKGGVELLAKALKTLADAQKFECGEIPHERQITSQPLCDTCLARVVSP